MASVERIRRKQLIRIAEGYLDLIMVFDDCWPLDLDLRQQMADRAIECLSAIKKPQGYKPYILFLKGQACRAAHRYSEAINYLQQSSRQDVDNVHTYLALAWCYKRIDRIDLAIEAMETAVQLDDHSAISHYNLACYWALANQADCAVKHLARAFELNPKYREFVDDEGDFDAIRNDRGFMALTALIA